MRKLLPLGVSPYRLALLTFVSGSLAAGALVACTSDDSSEPSLDGGCIDLTCLDGSIPDSARGFIDAQNDRNAANDTSIAPDTNAPPGEDADTNDAATPVDASDAAIVPDASDAGTADANDGGPTVLAAAGAPYLLALGGGYVYWSESGNGSGNAIKRVSTNGGTVTTIATGNAAGGASMFADANNVYWTTQGADVYQCAHGSTTLVHLATNQYYPTAITSDGTYVYWVPTGTSATIYRMPIGGGDAGTLTPNVMDTPTSIAFAGGKMYVSLRNTSGGFGAGTVGVLPGDGGVPIPLWSNLDGPQQLLFDGTRLYWTDDEGPTPNGIESRVLADGGSIVYTQNELHPQIATDGVNLYYTEYTQGFSGHVVRRPVDTVIGGTTLYTTSYPYRMAVDATYIYWVDRIDNVIYRGDK